MTPENAVSEKVLVCLKAQEKNEPVEYQIRHRLPVNEHSISRGGRLFSDISIWVGPGIDPNSDCCHYLRSRPCPKGNHVVTIPDVIEGTRGMQTPANRSLITHSERVNVVLNDKRQLRPCQDGVNCRRAKRLTCDSQSRHPGRHRTSQTMQIHRIKPYCQPED